MSTRNLHPNQGREREKNEAVDKQIGILFQVYERFGHDMSDVERASVRDLIYGLTDVPVKAEIKPAVS